MAGSKPDTNHLNTKDDYKNKRQNRPRGYKTFFMLNSTEHEHLNAHKYKNFKRFVSL